MGLDDFIVDSDSDSSASDKDNHQETNEEVNEEDDQIQSSEMTFYGTEDVDLSITPMEREGAMSDYSTAELVKGKEGDIEHSSDDIKFHAPVFFIITIDDKYKQGHRYQLKDTGDTPKASWNGRVVACIGAVPSKLGEINKEVVMLDTGYTDKADVMAESKSKLGDNLTGDTDVYINFFGDTMFMRDLAQANQQYKAGRRINIDKIRKKVLQRDMLRVKMKKEQKD